MAGEPYDYTLPNPQVAFQNAYAFGQQIAAQRAAQQQALLKQQKQQQAKQAMQMVYDNPTPENVSKFYMAYPEYKEQFETARKPLTDAAKADDLDFSSRAMILLTNGRTDAVDELLQSRITALKNTPGREQEAAATEAVAKTIKADPQLGKQLFGMKIAAADPELYKTIFGQSEKTTMDKQYDAIAARNGKSAADSWWDAQITKDKLIPVAGIGLFRAEDIGSQDNLPRINTKEEADRLAPGARFIAPDGSIKTKPGGGVSNGTSGFRSEGNPR